MGYWKSIHKQALHDARSTLWVDTGERVAIGFLLTVVSILFIWSFSGMTNALDETITKIAGTLAAIAIFPLVYMYKFIQGPSKLHQKLNRLNNEDINKLDSEIKRLQESIDDRPTFNLYLVRSVWGWCIEIEALGVDAKYFAHLDFSWNSDKASLPVPMPAIWPMHPQFTEYEILAKSRDMLLIYAIEKDFQNEGFYDGQLVYSDGEYRLGFAVAKWMEPLENIKGEPVIIEATISCKPRPAHGSKRVRVKIFGPTAEILEGDIVQPDTPRRGNPAAYYVVTPRIVQTVFDPSG